jgi:hypothetical protein
LAQKIFSFSLNSSGDVNDVRNTKRQKQNDEIQTDKNKTMKYKQTKNKKTEIKMDETSEMQKCKMFE